MADYGLYTNEEEFPGQGLVLKKTRRKLVGGTITGDVQPERVSVLPKAKDTFRERAAELFQQGSDLYGSEPDMAQLQTYAKQRGEQGQNAMLGALAAQFAGESFAPVQQQLLKKAAEAQDSMKVGGGLLTPDGQYIKDPFASRDKRAEFLLQQAKAYEAMATAAETREEQQAYRAQQDRLMMELRQFMAQTGRMNALTAQGRAAADAGGGGLGGGTATQVGSGSNNEPVFRQRDGRLFTYDQQGAPTPYSGPVLPKASNAQPTEDERKAAGWFRQADNAIKNITSVLESNPAASRPSVPERLSGLIPLVGEDIANTLRPQDRQKFVQAASSMAEALLRAATGAAITGQEIEQKQRELVPQIGDSAAVVKQKLDSYRVYMDSLKTRAGRAMPSNAPGAPASPGPVVDFGSLPK